MNIASPLPPGGVRELVRHDNHVVVETNAGIGSGFSDDEYVKAGATIAHSAEEVWQRANMIVKVKEPLPSEYPFLRDDLILFTYLHLAANEELTHALVDSGVTGIAYETVELANGHLPLLQPMSEVAGRMATQIAAQYLERPEGGRGILMGGVPGVPPAHVVILGGGTVGTNAAQIALGMGAQVTLLDVNLERLRYLDEVLHGRLTTVYSSETNISDALRSADAVIGAVLVTGARAPRLVTREMLALMPQPQRDRGRGGRSGRLRRDHAPDHPQRPHLFCRRRAALWRRQHAGRGAAHVQLGALQRDAALRPQAGGRRSAATCSTAIRRWQRG